MFKFTSKLTILALILWLTTSKAFSQQTVLNSKGDTTICFTVGQSKYLLKQVYKVKECDTLRSICEKQRVVCDSINTTYVRMIRDYSEITQNDKKIIGLKQYEIDKLNDSLKVANREIRKQKLFKFVSFGATGLVAGLFGYHVITHR